MTHPAWGAFLRRDWRIAMSYRFPFVAAFLSSVLFLGLYFFLSELVRSEELPIGAGREQGYFAYAIVGIILFEVLTVGLYTVASRIRDEQMAGTLEAVVATPVSTWLIALGSTTYEMLYGIGGGVFTALAGIAIYGLRVDVKATAVPALFACAAATLVLCTALGIAIGALTLIIKRTVTVAALMSTAVAMLSGVYFPTDLLPEPVASLAWAFPFRWSLDVARPTLFGGHVPLEELGALVVVSIVALPLSIVAFERALERTKRRGTLAQY
jgi:ABC-2 type transport system permease protein